MQKAKELIHELQLGQCPAWQDGETEAAHNKLKFRVATKSAFDWVGQPHFDLFVDRSWPGTGCSTGMELHNGVANARRRFCRVRADIRGTNQTQQERRRLMKSVNRLFGLRPFVQLVQILIPSDCGLRIMRFTDQGMRLADCGLWGARIFHAPTLQRGLQIKKISKQIRDSGRVCRDDASEPLKVVQRDFHACCRLAWSRVSSITLPGKTAA